MLNNDTITKSFGKFDVFLCQVDPFVHCQSYYLKERDIEQRSWPNTELRTYFDATLILMYVAYDLLYRQYNLVLRLLKKLQPVLMSDQFHVLVLYSRPWQKDQLSFLNQSRRGCCDWGKGSKVSTGKKTVTNTSILIFLTHLRRALVTQARIWFRSSSSFLCIVQVEWKRVIVWLVVDTKAPTDIPFWFESW